MLVTDSFPLFPQCFKPNERQITFLAAFSLSSASLFSLDKFMTVSAEKDLGQ